MNEKLTPRLNSAQVEAVKTKEGNLLIIASAGTGKTTTIVERYVNLVENCDFKPDEIMMTTFTNKAAKDMVEKISKRTDKLPKYIGTMHSLFLRILRDYPEEAGIKQNFTLLTEEGDKKKIVREIIHKLGLNPTANNVLYFINRINRFKNAGIEHESLEENKDLENPNKVIKEEIEGEVINVTPAVEKLGIRVYKEYQKKLLESNILDFDDILLLTHKLFTKNESIRKRYADNLKSIMVDEAQDLNVVQRNILEALQNDNLCLIGDDCQNIYAWRGASNELIFQFDKKHKKIVLEDNYRSNRKIIEAVNNIIKSLSFKIDKKLKCTREEGREIKVREFSSFNDEIEFIVSETKKLIKNKENLVDMAVLFRTNKIGKQIEREFRRNKIPCYLTRARGFLDREEVKDILSFLKLKANPYSRIEFERVVGLIEGIGKAKINTIEELSERNNISFIETFNHLADFKLPIQVTSQLSRFNILLKEETKNPIDSFLKFFDYNRKMSKKYEDEPEKLEDKEENINTLKELFEGFDYNKAGIILFLDSLIDMEKKEKDKNKVILSTIHSAKGLEWKHLFLAGCNDRILPFYFDTLSKIKRDDELRLFYVAVSRAKDTLTITYSNSNNFKSLEPSPFLEIIQ